MCSSSIYLVNFLSWILSRQCVDTLYDDIKWMLWFEIFLEKLSFLGQKFLISLCPDSVTTTCASLSPPTCNFSELNHTSSFTFHISHIFTSVSTHIFCELNHTSVSFMASSPTFFINSDFHLTNIEQWHPQRSVGFGRWPNLHKISAKEISLFF